MINEWTGVQLSCVPYKTTGTFVLRGVDEVTGMLDDHIVKTQTMMGSPFIKPIQGKCKEWEKKLVTLQLTLEDWILCQRTWMYLEPIFGSEDIMRQMPAEGRRFASVDGMWRKAMQETFDQPQVMEVAKRDNLLEKFRSANKMLDQIQKGLNDYLEIKRLAFPRFYFLSNDELLEILSQTKDPTAVQQHLNKCFEGINRVKFRYEASGNKDERQIVAMESAEMEVVEIMDPVDPDRGANKGNVEAWLLELQLSMRLTIKDVIKRSMVSYEKVKRKNWVLSWPGMVVICVGCFYWTMGAEKAMAKSGLKGLEEFEAELNGQLQDLVYLVRAKLSKLDRMTLGALTVIDLHARDVITNMVEQKVELRTDFNWLSQLRYYWEEKPDDYNRYGKDPWNMMPQIVNATVMYGYEYLGNSTRLVITPLTDRCYRTLMGAICLSYGGAPAGPAGTGKTETVKDLAKAVAKQCVVFNCSDGLDYLAMAKFFKGLAATGAWSCFDEFNRIELEVLSVIAQQILTITKAKQMRVATFLFEGTILPLNPDANVFITMNPGYAGRTELPDNLKALFRPCAMMVPDYALIAEIKLYSFGFERAREMARKLTQVLTLSSEQLSSQKHYDYGMRAVFSILVRAGNLRQSLGDKWTEDLLVLSSINDVNLPKFTTGDLPLFRGITQDLFPGVKLPQPDYEVLLNTIVRACKSQNLQPKDDFVRACVQLFETVQVRHGLMVVGATLSGKTSIFRVLQEGMTTAAANKEHADFDTVHIHTMNPKSITQGQLYGNFDENTHEWTDGVLAIIFRTCSKDTSPERHWIMFDGPVDAVWIESMNTVLDDNKKLCLNSGEIIKMNSKTTMTFEPEDLEEASPATVSRVGIVYVEPKRLGWRPLVQSWLNVVPDSLKPYKQVVTDLFEWLAPPLLFFIGNYARTVTPVTPIELVHSVLRLMDCLLDEPFWPKVGEDGLPQPNKNIPKESDAPRIIEANFFFATIWSIGTVMDADSRKKFDVFFKAALKGELEGQPIFKDFFGKNPKFDAHYVGGGRALSAFEGDLRADDEKPSLEFNRQTIAAMKTGRARVALSPIPEEGSCFDHQVAPSKGTWTPWEKLMTRIEIPRDAAYNTILVPTVDTVRNSLVIDSLMYHRKHVLCVGDTGTGKSVQMLDKLLRQIDKTKYQNLLLAFSAQTQANQIQEIIDGKVNRRRKGVFGPPMGTGLIIFVDDLNMPAKEKYGAQPPIELLRQWMDHGGWYDRKSKDQDFMQLVDLQFCAAMGPPGGGRTRITQRYVRQFNIIGCVPFDDSSLERVFSSITNWFSAEYKPTVKPMIKSVVTATIDLYNLIARERLPTPSKSHYTFNMRDLSKVFQGMQQARGDEIKEPPNMIRLWAHECMRVFKDRLTDDPDRAWFDAAVAEKVKLHFKKDWREVKGSNETILFGNWMDTKAVKGKRVYVEIEDQVRMTQVIATYLEDFNAVSKKRMDLVMFMNAIEHVARVSRIVNLPYGNALLVGVGGSGRKSLTTLAVSMAEFGLFQVAISKTYGVNEWRDDLKRLIRIAGEDGNDVVFLFNDTQIVKESFVEDINNILNNGEVPNLFPVDEKAAILETMDRIAQKEEMGAMSPSELYTLFVARSRAHLHVVLCFSPIGEAFRTRLRMFPSLVNCTTIDWFTAWPEEALRSVATYFLNEIELPEAVRRGIIDVCVDMQQRVSDLSVQYLAQLRRYYYVTPTSYLELINTFKGLINVKRNEVMVRKQRYENGLEKLASTAAQVDGMKKELIDLQPKLKVAAEETEVMLGRIDVMQKDANVTKEVVAGEEKICSAQAAAAQEMKSDCEAQLAEAIPALEGAIRALQTLKKSDIAEVKAMKKPPDGVKITMEAVCIMLSVAPKMVPNPDGKGPKVPDYWEPSQKEVLGDPKFLQRLLDYDKDNISIAIMDKVRPFGAREDFTPDRIKQASIAAAGLCKWVHAMITYDRVAKVVAPKKAALAIASEELLAAAAALAVKQGQLKEIMDQLAELQEQLRATMARKNELARQVTECSNRLERATKLTGGLGGERSRWMEAVVTLSRTFQNVVGDILLSAGLIAYLGAFTMQYRDRCVREWSALLRTKSITCADDFKLANALGDPVAIRAWTIAKLPNDAFSIDNAIMLTRSKRWPLMIDPQGQANRWVRNVEGANGLKVVKQTQSTFVRTIENAIQFGKPVLLENVPEQLDPVLESVLLRQVIKQGGVMVIRVGDALVEYDASFKLYITTKLSSPHYPPETCVMVNLLNFMATEEGLQDQMLGITVKKEMPKLEEEREMLVLQDAANKRALEEIENRILELLASAKGNILDDDVLIEALTMSKKKSDEIFAQVKVAHETQEKIAKARTGYIPVAKRASLLFFCIADLATVDPMYQYSLEWYVNLFLLAIDKSPACPDLASRLRTLNDKFTNVLYENVCRRCVSAGRVQRT